MGFLVKGAFWPPVGRCWYICIMYIRICNVEYLFKYAKETSGRRDVSWKNHLSFSGEWKVLHSPEEIQHVQSRWVVPPKIWCQSNEASGSKHLNTLLFCNPGLQFSASTPRTGHNLSQQKIQPTNTEVLSCYTVFNMCCHSYLEDWYMTGCLWLASR